MNARVHRLSGIVAGLALSGLSLCGLLALSACSYAPRQDSAAESPRPAAQAQDPAAARTDKTVAFIKAARDGDADAVKRFLEDKGESEGAVVDARNADGETALLAAAASMSAETVQMLVTAGADVNVKNRDSGWTPLMTAAFFGAADIARILLDAGADVNATNLYGETALLQATFRGQDDVVKVLLAHGADVAPRNDKGFTALRAARHKQYTGIVQALEDSGARE